MPSFDPRFYTTVQEFSKSLVDFFLHPDDDHELIFQGDIASEGIYVRKYYIEIIYNKKPIYVAGHTNVYAPIVAQCILAKLDLFKTLHRLKMTPASPLTPKRSTLLKQMDEFKKYIHPPGDNANVSLFYFNGAQCLLGNYDATELEFEKKLAKHFNIPTESVTVVCATDNNNRVMKQPIVSPGLLSLIPLVSRPKVNINELYYIRNKKVMVLDLLKKYIDALDESPDEQLWLFGNSYGGFLVTQLVETLYNQEIIHPGNEKKIKVVTFGALTVSKQRPCVTNFIYEYDTLAQLPMIRKRYDSNIKLKAMFHNI